MRVVFRVVGRAFGVLVVAFLGAESLLAQASVPVAPVVAATDTLITAPRGQYDVGGVHRFFLGDLNRELWEAQFPAPVLQLDQFAGGLTPVRRGGGLQTQSLRLMGADGQLYNFRSIDKNALRAMDPVIARTIVGSVRQDQIAALFPLSAMVVAPLLRATGVLHADPTLVVLPDDPKLGEFREEFAGLVGWIEVRPDEGPDGEPGFAGSTRVSGSDRLLERLEESPEHKVNGRSFLRARLMDVYVGDWDRHPDQWRWAGFEVGDSTMWEPIPRDRDWALARLDGLFVYAAGWIFPHYKGFATEYPSMFRATWAGRALDRHILPKLSRSDFVEVAQELQGVLTDEVIDQAVGTLPESYLTAAGPFLTEALRNRRNGFVTMAEEYYELLAGWVDIEGTDRRDFANVERLGGDQVRVRMYRVRQGEPEARPYFDRTFLGSETKEIRIFLRGNDDRAVVSGTAPSTIGVRLVGGGSDDELVNESPNGKTYFYDHRGDNELRPIESTHVDEDDYDEPFDPRETTQQAKHRDWGHSWIPYPTVAYDSDEGYYVGAKLVRDEFGFRYFPWESRFTLEASAGGRGDRGNVRTTLDAPIFRRRARFRIDAGVRFREVARFFGYGNDLQFTVDDDEFKFDRTTVDVRTELAVLMADSHVEFALGGAFGHMHAERGDADQVDSLAPYGFPDFTHVRLTGRLSRDTRDRALVPTEGSLLELSGSVVPAVLDADRSYSTLSGRIQRYFSTEAAGQPTLAVRLGAQRVFGTAPYLDAAILGSSRTLLGITDSRYAGDTEVDGSVLGSFKLFNVGLIVPSEVGIHGLGGVGRVWVDGESPGGWHSTYGGGIWVSFYQRPFMASFTMAGGDEEARYYFRVGLPF